MESQNKTNPAYPSELNDLEDNLLKKRRGSDDISNKIGFGLSGGGIRSATFCLGIFQGLAKQELPQPQSNPALKTLLSKIDFLSTVSGGGFFGSFYGRLFTRKQVANFADVAEILTARAASEEERGDPKLKKLPKGKVFRWLRENGRYLAPNGAGDLLIAGAAVIRNLAAVQIVLATFALMIFLVPQLFRRIIGIAARCSAHAGSFGKLWSCYQGLLIYHLPWGTNVIWWSPYAILPAVTFLFFAVPPAWSYWLVEKPNHDNAGNWIPPVWGVRAVIVMSVAGIVFGLLFGDKPMIGLSLLVFILAAETLIWWVRCSGRKPASTKPPETMAETNDAISEYEDIRLRLSNQLKKALLVTAVLLAFVVIDSLAQTAYAAALLGKLHVKLWVTAAFAPLIGLGGFGRRIFAALGDRADGKSFGVPLKLVAGIAAVVITGLLMVMLDVASYAITWRLGIPAGVHPDWTVYQKLTEAQRLAVTPKEGGWTIKPQDPPPPRPAAEGAPIPSPMPTPGLKANEASSPQATAAPGWREIIRALWIPAFALTIAFVMSILFGWSWPFLNRSTQHPIYTSRLIRAYLGASNRARLTSSANSVTQAIPDDDIPEEGYWPRHLWLKSAPPDKPVDDAAKAKLIEEAKKVKSYEKAESIKKAEQDFFKKGTPLHLVNVTINETLDSQSQVEQQDRKGLGMAVGPAAISAGVVHHLVLKGPPSDSPWETPFRVYPGKGEGYSIFRYPDRFSGELLSLGNWTGISGAAFSTSLGSLTSFGFSVLAGLANVRLSYWWNSGVEPHDLLLKQRWMVTWAPKLIGKIAPAFCSRLASYDERDALAGAPDPKTRFARWSSALFQLAFSVQSFLFDELFARFHGTARQWWPLSDGGHFENMGGYELIRRRLDVIVIIDAEADPDYTFEGMANLVRKARLDFGAEIRFSTEDELNCRVHRGVRKYFGTLEQLRRGTWIEEPVEDPNVPDATAKFTPPKRKRLSLNPVDENSLSLAHAALATVTYNDERPPDGSLPPIKHWLLYIKPSLVGDEPSDVRRYHTEHPSFPNETTAEQFFDEAQWESYRRLGEHIADKVFRSRDDQGNLLTTEANRFFPYMFEVGPPKQT